MRIAGPRRAPAPDRKDKLDAKQLSHLLYHESGLLGVSGVSPSPKELLEVEQTNPRARAALELYVRRIVREIGALTAVLGGLDMLAFTAGVGENSAVLRERICEALRWLGIDIDDEANLLQCVHDLAADKPRARCRRTHERGMDGGPPCSSRASRTRGGHALHSTSLRTSAHGS